MRRLSTVALFTVIAASAYAQTPQLIAQRFALGFLPYSPGSTIEARVDYQGTTPGGAYQAITALRSSLKGANTDQLNLIVDLTGRQIAAGYPFPIPPLNPPVDATSLPQWVETGLPELLSQILRARVQVHWPSSPMRQTAVIPVTVRVQTGYEWVTMPTAVTGDGKYVILGSLWPIDRDPRAVRREILASAKIQWDAGSESAVIKLVEFSDFQCPACKRGWGATKPIWTSFKGRLRHGLVNNPLWTNHPWAFRAAVAGVCVGKLWPERVTELKEEFYQMQENIKLDSVDTVALGFLDQHDLDAASFRACYMKDPAIAEVIASLELGYRLGVMGTPTYYANGEAQPFGEADWITKRIESIIEAKGIPENAAEIKATPPPAATPAGASPATNGKGAPTIKSAPAPKSAPVGTAAPAGKAAPRR